MVAPAGFSNRRSHSQYPITTESSSRPSMLVYDPWTNSRTETAARTDDIVEAAHKHRNPTSDVILAAVGCPDGLSAAAPGSPELHRSHRQGNHEA
mmetsp:Transcript_103564/g.232510  ORF Transcript_103564/g.232510 Transcript_103564/m.232510 type:complete len:95 (+) Transcript_103564:153-437(+)